MSPAWSLALLVLAFDALTAGAAPPARAPFTIEALMTLDRISDPQLSPDGQTVLFTVQTVDLPANTKPSQIYRVSVNGGDPVAVTHDGKRNQRARWLPDSRHFVFVSDRGGSSQVWLANQDGAGLRQLTDLPTEVDNVTVSPDGHWLVFTSDVFPSCGADAVRPGNPYQADCNKQALSQESNAKMSARVYTSLLYRHWTSYSGPRRTHLLVQSIEGGTPRDLTPGKIDVPPFALGGPDAYVFSPDSKQVIYVSNTETDLATSTNSDLFAVAVEGGEARRLTTNAGADNAPQFSPDGHLLAYRAQVRSGYESDRWRLAVYHWPSGRTRMLTEPLDRSVDSFAWASDSKVIYFTADQHGTKPLMSVPVTGAGEVKTVMPGIASIDDVQIAAHGSTMIFSRNSATQPVELYRSHLDGSAVEPLTRLNDSKLSALAAVPVETITVKAQDGTPIESFLLKPPDFQAGRHYPVVFLIHGGPEGAWEQAWSYRWNPQIFASAGFVVVMPNPRGSVGFGQRFTDAVNLDWGGTPFTDIMSTVDYVSKLSYVDAGRLTAAGASYGGYMIDWMLGHTDQFKAFVTHAGVFDLLSEAGTTEELWFVKWEFGGFPWDNPQLYTKWSPSSYVPKFKTPTLVTHGELDYRVPIGQGQELFTALQERHIPSKLIQFPDEGHWILKPQNSVFWYQSVLGWLKEFSGAAPSPAAPASRGGVPSGRSR